MKTHLPKPLGTLTILCLSLLAAGSRASAQTTDYMCETNNGTILIYRYIGEDGAVTIPGTINGLPVASIGSGAFRGCTSLTSVTIGNNVTYIGGVRSCIASA